MYNDFDKSVIEIDDDEYETKEPIFHFQDNKPRKIIFCIDISTEMSETVKPSDNTGIKNSSLQYSTRLETVQNFVKRYMLMNRMIGNTRDEYAIITLSDEASWWLDCTTSVSKVDNEIDFLDSQLVQEYNSLDIKSLFNTIGKNVNVEDDEYFVHAIVLYARTNVFPSNIKKEKYTIIRDSRNFVMDVIFIHDDGNSTAQDVYDAWNVYDSEINSGWYYETTSYWGKEKVSKALAQLVGHPLQRSSEQESISRLVRREL